MNRRSVRRVSSPGVTGGRGNSSSYSSGMLSATASGKSYRNAQRLPIIG